jgi:CDP-diacylglycerol---serine O-phosphatidyltransferase
VIPLRQLIPNSLTAASLVLALCSIISAGLGDLERAAWFILWCVLLDIADGPVARLLNARSEFGASFDSLADLVAFGLAPAALVLHLFWQDPAATPPWWVATACALHALLTAIRLARFNAGPQRPGWFQGVPSTVCGALLASGVILLLRHQPDMAFVTGAPWLLLVLPALGLAMVSKLPFPKLGTGFGRPLNLVLLANLPVVYVCAVLRLWPEYLAGMAVLVLLGGLAAGIRSPQRD